MKTFVCETSTKHPLVFRKSNPSVPSALMIIIIAWQQNSLDPSRRENLPLPLTFSDVPSAPTIVVFFAIC